jgi:hypothetical protein
MNYLLLIGFATLFLRGTGVTRFAVASPALKRLQPPKIAYFFPQLQCIKKCYLGK